MVTKVWVNPEDEAFAVENPRGLFLGGYEANELPDWAKGDPDYIFGDEIEWNGGEDPTDGEPVLCRFRHGGYYLRKVANPHGALWVHAPARGRPNPSADVVSYQVVTNV